MNYLIGIDAGTTSFKAVLCHMDGKVAASARREYSLIAEENHVEFPAEEYWNIFCAVTKELFDKSGIPPECVVALAISSQGETLVCVDSEGKSIGNAIVWLDNRSSEECSIISKHFNPEEIYRHTGQCEVVPTWTATKIMWIKKHEPERFSHTHKFLLLEDFLLYRLTGRFVCERTLPASTLLYDMPTGEWWDDMLFVVGIDKERLPELADSASPVGRISGGASTQSGLSTKTLAVTGALDQIAAIVGAASIEPGQITEVTGSCLVVETVSDRFPLYFPELSITCQPFCIPGKFLLLMFSNTAGMALKWFRDSFYPDGSMGYSALTEEAERVSPGAEGLVMLPHLAGSQFPKHNPDAKASFLGITLAHGRGHFIRAILESVAYTEKSMLEVLEQAGYKTDNITSLGGGAYNTLWSSIKTDVTGRQISTVQVAEPASMGAAALAGIGCGTFKSLEDTGKMMVKNGEIFTPDKDNYVLYQDLYKKYILLNEQTMVKPNEFK